MNSKSKLLQIKHSLVQTFHILKSRAVFMTPLNDNLEHLFYVVCEWMLWNCGMTGDWLLIVW